ncbi:MAG: folate-binding protein YgfZ [Gammaproteobacteria bacterium]|nr:folate-binding protein YgfZ [Gammaproteobacteria bacterium]
MTASWQEFLAALGARCADGQLLDFGELDAERAAALGGNVLAPLSPALLRFAGADAAKLLHGQLSQDIQNLPEHASVLAGFANVQGRLRAIVRVSRFEDAYWLQTQAGVADAVQAEFRKFAPLYRQLKLDAASDGLVVLGLAGQIAAERVLALFGALPEQPGQGVAAKGLLALRLPGAGPRFQLMGREATVRERWAELSLGFTLVGPESWELTEIAAGLPEVHAETAQAYLPLHINLQLVDGIHWKKGCYTGQEIIARMHYRSTLKRHAYLAHARSDTRPAPGMEVFSGGQAVGTVVRAARAGAGLVHLLTELPIEAKERGEVRLGSADGPILEFDELPYSLVASYQSSAS